MKTKQRELINQAIDAETEEVKTAKVSWEGKQFVVRFPSIISNMAKIQKDDSVEFRVDYDTKEVKLKLIRGFEK